MTQYALELIAVTAGYGDNPIVRGFSARLLPGSITTLIGGNGAGKSTLLRAIYGTNRRFSGEIRFEGANIEHLPAWDRLRRGVGLVPQGRCNFPQMTVAENLKMGCYTLPAKKHEEAIGRATALFPVLGQKWKLEAGNLSGGEQQVLEMAMVLLCAPTLLLLDEPSLGLSPLLVEELFALILRLNRDGLAILLVEQNAVQSLEISNRAYILEHGSIVMSGTADAIRNNPDLKRAYLGM